MIRQHGFAALVTRGPDGLTADHVPMEIDSNRGPLGTLVGHVSRANPVWQYGPGSGEVLALFQGPQGYVTPAWYPSKGETGKVVPTWNSAVVHAHGHTRAIEG